MVGESFPVLPAWFFYIYHVIGGWIIGRTVTFCPHPIPVLTVFFGIQGLIEHYADKFPTVAKLNAPLTLVLLGFLGYWLYTLFAISTAPHWVLWAAIAIYFAVVGIAKTMELGFPKDTVEEQVSALKDPNYNFWHFWLHNFFTAFFLFLSATCPGVFPKDALIDFGGTALAEVREEDTELPSAHMVVLFGVCLMSFAVGVGIGGRWCLRRDVAQVDATSLLVA
mmetsp:Transcript_4690/g.11816  ORF Transcript_4690/g.11816 Transcript_4690/m.11816 type:complete len:223 (-) Transcript_4690:7-675(-)